MKDAALAAALTAIALVALPLGVGAQGKPTNTYDVQTDGGYSVSSLGDLWKLSSVIAEVHLGSPHQDDGLLRTMGMPALTYDGTIVTLLKADAVVTTPESPISVSRAGGRVDRGDHFAEYVDSKFSRFVPEKTYLLFLRRDKTGRYWPATGTPDSAYLIERETVRALGKTSFTATVVRMSRTALIDAVKRAGGGQP